MEDQINETVQAFKNTNKKTTALQMKYDALVQTWDRIWELSNLYIEKYIFIVFSFLKKIKKSFLILKTLIFFLLSRFLFSWNIQLVCYCMKQCNFNGMFHSIRHKLTFSCIESNAWSVCFYPEICLKNKVRTLFLFNNEYVSPMT